MVRLQIKNDQLQHILSHVVANLHGLQCHLVSMDGSKNIHKIVIIRTLYYETSTNVVHCRTSEDASETEF